MKTILALASLLLLLPNPGSVDPQTVPDRGLVYGRVTDARTGDQLASVRVYIVDAKIGTLTDQEGRFLLVNVPLGEATVRMERLCYHPVTVKLRLSTTLPQRRADLGLPIDHEQGCDWRIY